MTKKQISADIIADSKNEFGNRLTTFVVTLPRIVLAEFNTHRVLSRNSASSRAIPFKKMLKMVLMDPFIPIAWMKDHSGMQGNQYFEGFKLFLLKQLWLSARNFSVMFAWLLSKLGLTKQIVNRLLEPFMWHTIICTASEWENFFALRAHGAAEIHIQKLAFIMLEKYNQSSPKLLKAGEWHVPFGENFDIKRLDEIIQQKEMKPFQELDSIKDIQNRAKEHGLIFDEIAIKISTARCARVSYMNFEGKDDYYADLKLHDTLLSSGHMSPFEHCAKAMTKDENFILEAYHFDRQDEITRNRIQNLEGWSGNFRGFTQYRKLLPGENKLDLRINKK